MWGIAMKGVNFDSQESEIVVASQDRIRIQHLFHPSDVWLAIGAFFATGIMLMMAFSPWVFDIYREDMMIWSEMDIDNDGLIDDQEAALWYSYDIIQCEDYDWSSASNVNDYQLFVEHDIDVNNDAYTSYFFEADMGNYRFYFSGTGDVEIRGDNVPRERLGELDEEYRILIDSLTFDIFDPFGNPVNVFGVLSGYEYLTYELSPEEIMDQRSAIQRVWYYKGWFNIGPGTHEMRMNFNNDIWQQREMDFFNDMQNLFPPPEPPLIPAPTICIEEAQIQCDKGYIERHGLFAGPIWLPCQDVDGDGVWDGDEVTRGSNPFKSDVDYDGLPDLAEWVEGTDPNYRDTDFDGIRDSVEIGSVNLGLAMSKGSYFERIGSDPNPARAMYPPQMLIWNLDQDSQTTTDPTVMDTDGDGLPDGCIDGWVYDMWKDEWANSNDIELLNGVHDKWEGEDLNLDGRIDYPNLGSPSAHVFETDPTLTHSDSDNDGLPDGWERWFSIDPNDDGINPPPGGGNVNVENGPNGDIDGFLIDANNVAHPYTSPGNFDPNNWELFDNMNLEGDLLLNIMEYTMGTNPRSGDTDGDALNDYEETSLPYLLNDGTQTILQVIFRTNVENGLISTENYGTAGDWVWFKGPITQSTGEAYEYIGVITESVSNQYWPMHGPQICDYDNNKIVYIHTIDSRSWIYKDDQNVYVCEYFYDTQTYTNSLKKYKFSRDDTQSVDNSESILLGYKDRQITITNPLSKHTDGVHYTDKVVFEDNLYDGIVDGDEPEWNLDYDNDGLVNARDIDSDNDGIQDPMEGSDYGQSNNDIDLDTKVNMMDRDMDGDGLTDYYEIVEGTKSKDNFEIDPDGYATFLEPFRRDSDGDGLIDGIDNWVMKYNEADGVDIPVDNDLVDVLVADGIAHEITTIVDSNSNPLYDEYTFFGEVHFSTEADNPDTDDDLLWDGWNVVSSWVDNLDHYGEQSYSTTADVWDTDTDGLGDGTEVIGWKITLGRLGSATKTKRVYSDPLQVHSDGDTPNGDGISDYDEYYRGLDPERKDTDGDGLWDNWEDADTDGELDTGETDPRRIDTDRDRIPDAWIDYNENNQKDFWEAEDMDGDGILDKDGSNNLLELDPTSSDSDGDGVSDSDEQCLVVVRLLDIYIDSSDTDNRMLVDVRESGLVLFELNGWVSSSTAGYDITDGAIPEMLEYMTPGYGPIPENPSSFIYYSPTDPDYLYVYDSDNPGFIEFERMAREESNLVPSFFDVHNNERFKKQTTIVQISCGYKTDTDSDGITDDVEIMAVAKFKQHYLRYMNVDRWYLDESTSDMEHDSLYNAFDDDSDQDGLSDYLDLWIPWFYSGSPDPTNGDEFIPQVDLDADGIPNMVDTDSDGDGYSDGEEADGGTDPTIHSSKEDTDTDGLSNGQEDNPDGDDDTTDLPTDKLDADTDGDGIDDGIEQDWNLDIDNDGLINALDVDSDGDGLWDGYDITLHVIYSDSDGDGIKDTPAITIYRDSVCWSTPSNPKTGHHLYDLIVNGVGSKEAIYKDVEELLLNPHYTDPDWLLMNPSYIGTYDLVFEINGFSRWYIDADRNTPHTLINHLTIDQQSEQTQIDYYARMIEANEYRLADSTQKWSYFDYYNVKFHGEDKNQNGRWELSNGETSPYYTDSDSDMLIDGRTIVIKKADYPSYLSLQGIDHLNRYYYEADGTRKNVLIFVGEDINGDGSPNSVDFDSDGYYDYSESNPLYTDSDGDTIPDHDEVFGFFQYDTFSQKDDSNRNIKWWPEGGDLWGEIGANQVFRSYLVVKDRNDFEFKFTTFIETGDGSNPFSTLRFEVDRVNADKTHSPVYTVYDMNWPEDPMLGDLTTPHDYEKRIWRYEQTTSNQALERYREEFEDDYFTHYYSNWRYHHNIYVEDLQPGMYRIKIVNGGSPQSLFTSVVDVKKRGIDPGIQDADGDLIKDADEIEGWYSRPTSPANSDSDFDGVDDWWEIVHYTNPNWPDTDFDGIHDGLDENPKGILPMTWSTKKYAGYDWLDQDIFNILWLEGQTFDNTRWNGAQPNAYNSDISDDHLEKKINKYVGELLGEDYQIWPNLGITQAQGIIDPDPGHR